MRLVKETNEPTDCYLKMKKSGDHSFDAKILFNIIFKKTKKSRIFRPLFLNHHYILCKK